MGYRVKRFLSQKLAIIENENGLSCKTIHCKFSLKMLDKIFLKFDINGSKIIAFDWLLQKFHVYNDINGSEKEAFYAWW